MPLIGPIAIMALLGVNCCNVTIWFIDCYSWPLFTFLIGSDPALTAGYLSLCPSLYDSLRTDGLLVGWWFLVPIQLPRLVNNTNTVIIEMSWIITDKLLLLRFHRSLCPGPRDIHTSSSRWSSPLDHLDRARCSGFPYWFAWERHICNYAGGGDGDQHQIIMRQSEKMN